MEDPQATEVADTPASRLDRLVGDDGDSDRKKLAVLCLSGFVTTVAAGGFTFGLGAHGVAISLGLWLLAAALLLCAWLFGWEPSESEPTTVTYYEAPPGPQTVAQAALQGRRKVG